MSGKTSKPMIKILISSITQHIESKNQSPRGVKDFDLGGGVGLGIVAALDNYSRDGPTKIPENKALFSRNLSRSKPIPANSSKVCEEMDTVDSFEEYSVVTCHGPKGSYSKVYYPNVRKSHDDQKSIRVECNSSSSVFHISPAKEAFDFSPSTSDDFLSSCNICLKKLHGKDIYMYRGEKAFCSTECRHKQIVLDDRREKYCSREASRRSHVAASPAADVSSSPYTNTEQIFSGILAS